MLIRISLIVAVVAALFVGALNILLVRDKINTLITQRDDFHTQRDQVQAQLSSTKRELAKTQDDLAQTQQDLTNAITQLTKVQADDQAQTKRANELADKLAKTSQELDDAQNQVAAYKATGYTPDQIGGLAKTIKSTQDELEAVKEENGVLNLSVHRLQNQLAELVGSNVVVTLRADLKGKIIAVDPKWEFVVLNVGEEQGVLDNGELLVSRDGKLVGKIIVRSVEKDRSIANIMPGWQLGQVFEGDVVTPAHPAT
jgi:myosin heavy subunit